MTDMKRMAELINFRNGKLVEYSEAPTVKEKYTHVVDSLGNVEVRDTETGESVYLEGSDALEAISLIGDKEGAELQKALSHFKHVME